MFIRSETERTTAVTDAILGVLCLILAWRLRAMTTVAAWHQGVWTSVLLLMATSALLGAVVHGVDLRPRLRTGLWKPLYLSLGLTVALVVVCAVGDWLGDAAARRCLPWAVGVGLGFFVLRELRGGGFRLFLVYEGTAIIAALAIYVSLAWAGAPGALVIAAGLLLSLVAGAVQMSGWSARLIVRVDHNGLFHLVQMASVMVIAAGVRARLMG